MPPFPLPGQADGTSWKWAYLTLQAGYVGCARKEEYGEGQVSDGTLAVSVQASYLLCEEWPGA